MHNNIANILEQDSLSRNDIIRLLSPESRYETDLILKKAAEIRKKYVGNQVYLRGLIEYSNICRKNCLYCGIRTSNKKVTRYTVDEDDVLAAARMADEFNYGSIVIQTGEQQSKKFTKTIAELIKKIKDISKDRLGITLSCGEQTRKVYQEWFDSGAHRYLLRFESSDPELYYRIHPKDDKHLFENRLVALNYLKEIGYQVGSGMMIGLPTQTVENLADDLLFLKNLDVDMVGMGPYIEHSETPLYDLKDNLLNKKERFERSILVIAVLRIMMKDINIASATALDSIDPQGREKAIIAGANVVMPNLTPLKFRQEYFLYENKPYITEAGDLLKQMDESDMLREFHIKLGYWGDSKHFLNKQHAGALS